MSRHYRWYDNFLISLNQALGASSSSGRPNPSDTVNQPPLSLSQQQKSARLMRVNHCGEVCAQALYLGQSFTQDSTLHQAFCLASQEEADHLRWCKQRLKELNSRPSLLNPLWFTGSVLMGMGASIAGKGWSLGFLAETEQQVIQHLEDHLQKLPLSDQKSRAILRQMQIDEAKHQQSANHLGSYALPGAVKVTMHTLGKVMTTLSYYL